MFNIIYEKILHNKTRKEEGKITSIYPPFERLSEKFPGWEKGTYTILTASSGVGKTKLTKFLCVTSIYNFCKTYNIRAKIFYFALEESKEEFWISMISTLLYEKYGISMHNSELKSLGKFIISDDILAKIEECKHIIDDMEHYFDVIDHIANPYGLYKHVRQWFENPSIGEYEYETKEDGEKVIKGYKYVDPDLYVFVITDHVSLLTPENGGSLHEAIGHYSKEYCLKGFCKRFKCAVINVQQQAAEKEKLEFFQGETVEQKMEPSLDGLANNKETQRDADLVIGLFAPARYNIRTHRRYDVTRLQDRYRSLKFLKDRNYGLANVYVPLFFDGAANIFKELPPSDQIKYEDYGC